MDRYRYNCNYCGVEYTPKRRYKQKYCSNSCRVNAFTRRQKVKSNLPDTKKEKLQPAKDKISWAGVGNAAAGTLVTNIVTNLLTKEDNKPATKGDLKKLLQGGVNNTIVIRNLPLRNDGARAYFDTNKQIIIYK